MYLGPPLGKQNYPKEITMNAEMIAHQQRISKLAQSNAPRKGFSSFALACTLGATAVAGVACWSIAAAALI